MPSFLPTVLIAGPRDASRAQISFCEDEGGYRVTRHLLDLGHRTVFHVAVPQSASGSSSRTAGWRRALREADAPIPDPIEATWAPESGQAIGRRLARLDHVTAVFAGNDEVAMGVIRGLRETGKRVPADVSVAGFDAHPLGSLFQPAVTTFRQDFLQGGELAWNLLDEQIRGSQEPRLVELHGSFQAGESSTPPAR